MGKTLKGTQNKENHMHLMLVVVDPGVQHDIHVQLVNITCHRSLSM